MQRAPGHIAQCCVVLPSASLAGVWPFESLIIGIRLFDAEKTWKVLEDAIHEINNHNASGLSFEELYRCGCGKLRWQNMQRAIFTLHHSSQPLLVSAAQRKLADCIM